MYQNYDFEWNDKNELVVAKVNDKDLSEEDKNKVQKLFETEDTVYKNWKTDVEKADNVYNEQMTKLKEEWKTLYKNYPSTRKLSSKNTLALRPFNYSFFPFWF